MNKSLYAFCLIAILGMSASPARADESNVDTQIPKLGPAETKPDPKEKGTKLPTTEKKSTKSLYKYYREKGFSAKEATALAQATIMNNQNAHNVPTDSDGVQAHRKAKPISKEGEKRLDKWIQEKGKQRVADIAGDSIARLTEKRNLTPGKKSIILAGDTYDSLAAQLSELAGSGLAKSPKGADKKTILAALKKANKNKKLIAGDKLVIPTTITILSDEANQAKTAKKYGDKKKSIKKTAALVGSPTPAAPPAKKPEPTLWGALTSWEEATSLWDKYVVKPLAPSPNTGTGSESEL